MDVKTQNFLILGVSKSGRAVSEYILDKGGKCYIYEELKSPKIDDAISLLTEKGAVFVDSKNIDAILTAMDCVIISPGIPINHDVAVRAKRAGKRIIGEMEFGFLQFQPTTIAVTGTNGKTTTVSLINSILEKSNRKSRLVGNVGIPVSSVIDETVKEDVLVTEVSSFQLETLNAFCPHIACILNISPDHLERHYNMENYIFLKRRLLKNQTSSEYSVLNFDDQTVRGFALNCGKIIWISLYDNVDGAYLSDGKLYYRNEYIIDENELAIKGEHNVYNALFAVAVCKLLGIDNDYIKNGLAKFKGVKHRVELISEKYGKKYFDDSKSTNTASSITAIKAMKSETVLILGGSEKGERYDELFNAIKGSLVKHVILMGSARYNMLDCAVKCGYNDVTLTSDFTIAVKIADMFTAEGECVLLSPACASFDSFSNFEERGDTFRKIVEEL